MPDFADCEGYMKRLLITLACFVVSLPCMAQNADEPASRDDVILYLRTMHSHDMVQRMMAVQAQTTKSLLHDTLVKDKGTLPPNFEDKFKKAMDDLVKNIPADEIVDAMIPAYQNHFTHGDIQAMTAFYASPVGQRVLQELPEVLQEGNKLAMPIMSKYMNDWMERVKHDFDDTKTPAKNAGTPVQQ
jgi:hypothetical protein